MNKEELECHLIELESSSKNTRGVLRQLIFQYCRAGEASKANAAYQRMLKEEKNVSAGILSAMLEVNTKSGNADEALKYLRDLKENYSGFRVDSYKIVDLCTALVKNERQEGKYLPT